MAIFDGDAGTVCVDRGDARARTVLQVHSGAVAEGEPRATRVTTAHVAAVAEQAARNVVGKPGASVLLPGEGGGADRKHHGRCDQQQQQAASRSIATLMALAQRG
ncbi:MAG TPA: hypothetical protein VEX18_16185 [Polyangiaceae bacterium]|nr:hypothetical protein [Polyangiaceae bacterium]